MNKPTKTSDVIIDLLARAVATIITSAIFFVIIGLLLARFCTNADAATTNEVGRVVLINDAGATRPAQSIATPGQVNTMTATAGEIQTAAEAAEARGTNAQAMAQAAYDRTALYSTDYVVTSTVYVQSIGGVPYDASNQTVRIHSIAKSGTNLTIVGTMAQEPLIPPVLDWRLALSAGTWTNIPATVTEVAVPGGVTNAVTAYQFDLPIPNLTNAFFRVVDNSAGSGGSGLYWLVYGGIYVDGHRGATTTLTNIVGSVTNTWGVVGGIVVDPEPL